jgi:hypothetical protein
VKTCDLHHSRLVARGLELSLPNGLPSRSGLIVAKPDITPKWVSQLSSQGAKRFVIGVYPNFQFAPLIVDGVPLVAPDRKLGVLGVDRLSDLYKRYSPAALAKALFRMPTVD